MVLGDFAARTPEVISGQIHTGPGSGSLLEAAAAWDLLAGELNSAAAAYGSVIAGLAGESWLGPSSTSMAAAVAPYVSRMSTTAAQAAQAAAEARAAAAAYETVLAATVPPAMIAANRSQLLSLMATNVVGQNSAAIAATEAQYGQMWAQDVAAMVGYATASTATGTRLTLFTKPPHTSSGGAQATNEPGPAATGPLQPILDLINDLTAGYKSFWEALLGAPTSALWEAFFGFAQAVGNQATWTNVVNGTTSLGIGQFKNFYRAPVVAVSKAPLQAGLTGPGLRAATGGVTTAVSAMAGDAPAVGALKVPPSWAGAAPAIRLASATVASAGSGAVPDAGLAAGLSGEAALGAMTGGMLGSPAARVVSSAKISSKVPTAKRLKEPVQLDRLIECLQEQPDAVQHWTVDEAGLDDLVAELTLKPGIHAVHVLDEDDAAAVVPGPVRRDVMRASLVLLGIATAIGFAVAAHAEPTDAADPVGDDAAFLAALQQAGIAYPGDDAAVQAGKTVCRLANHGETALQVLNDLRAADPELTLQGAALFVTIAARTYCPHQLDMLDS